MSFPSQVVVEIIEPQTPFGGVQVSIDNQPDVNIELSIGAPVLSVFGRIGNVVAQCSDYAACYAPLGSGLPPGGLLGQVLTKTSNASLAVDWETPASAGGTVTRVSANDLPNLFTTVVNNPTTTPDIQFFLDVAPAHNFFGNNTSIATTPFYVRPSITDLSDLSGSSKLVGSPSTGPGVGEITIGTGLSMSGSTLSATGVTPNFIDSIVLSGGNVSLVNDLLTPGNSQYYGTNSSGTRGYFALPSGVTGTKGAVGFSIGRSGGLTTGKVKGFVTIPYAATISAWNIVLDAGTATIRAWKIATGTSKPTVANTINTSGVSISSGTAVRGTLLTDFTTLAVAANDIFAFEITALSGPPTELFFSLELTKS